MHCLLTDAESDDEIDPDVGWLWAMSRVCESFGCLPDQAERLLLDDPTDRAVRIMELRAYADAYRAYTSHDGKVEDLEESPMMDAVIENVFRLHQQRVARRSADG